MLKLISLSFTMDIAVGHVSVLVGRHGNCDARLDSPLVSRWHCLLTREGRELVVRDLGSANGTRINGQRVELGRLKPGDELSIAHLLYRLEETRATPPAEDCLRPVPMTADVLERTCQSSAEPVE
jgi:pSer/pThr/pTyr-binding forkhead associated (FHA) protein